MIDPLAARRELGPFWVGREAGGSRWFKGWSVTTISLGSVLSVFYVFDSTLIYIVKRCVGGWVVPFSKLLFNNNLRGCH